MKLDTLDGSLFAEGVLPKAVELIRNNDAATLTVAARLREDGVPGVRTSVWYGAAAPSILEAAAEVA
jgi:hypothetical protein